MGIHKDLGFGIVEKVDERTGCPKDRSGYLLNRYSDWDGSLIEGWDKLGTKLTNLTNPYGLLEFAVGNGDDFFCFDYNTIRVSSTDGWLILHSVINSETGCFIMDDEYLVIPWIEYDMQSLAMVERALDGCAQGGIKHSKSGWNQDPYYFHRVVHIEMCTNLASSDEEIPVFSQRQLRFGGKRINRYTKVNMK